MNGYPVDRYVVDPMVDRFTRPSTLTLLREYAAVAMVGRDAVEQGATPSVVTELRCQLGDVVAALFPDGGPPEKPVPSAVLPELIDPIPYQAMGLYEHNRRLGAPTTNVSAIPWGGLRWPYINVKARRTLATAKAALQPVVNRFIGQENTPRMHSVMRDAVVRELASMGLEDAAVDVQFDHGEATVQWTARAPSRMPFALITGSVSV